MRQHIWRSAKWMSLGISVGSIIVAIVLVSLSGPEQIKSSKVETEEPKTEVENPILVERKDGDIIWQLRAEEASQQLNGQMRLSMPELTLYTQAGQQAHITSQQAWFDPLKRNVRFKGNVLVRHDIWTLSTDTMIYVSATDEIHIPGPFKAWSETVKARGKNMRLHRTNGQVTVDDGIWIEDRNPQWQGVK